MITDAHPLFIHFPIALLSAAIVFDIIYLITKKPELAHVSWWTMLFGLISSCASIATGLIDDTLIGHFGAVWPLWNNHGVIQILSSFLFLGLFLFRSSKKNIYSNNRQKFIYLFIGVFAVASLFYGAHLGAQLSGRI